MKVAEPQASRKASAETDAVRHLFLGLLCPDAFYNDRRQWIVSVIVIVVCLAAVIGVVLYLDTYFG
jgi:hypothetical protein